jgi:hypothetical protein
VQNLKNLMLRVYAVCLAHLYLFDCNVTSASASNFFFFLILLFPFTSNTLFITNVTLVCTYSSFGLVSECLPSRLKIFWPIKNTCPLIKVCTLVHKRIIFEGNFFLPLDLD